MTDLDPRLGWAAERTLLAWVRTGVAMMGFGFVVARFGLFLREISSLAGTQPQRSLYTAPVGIGLVVLGTMVVTVATLRHWRTGRALARNELVRPDLAWSVVVGLAASVVGGFLAVMLLRAGID